KDKIYLAFVGQNQEKKPYAVVIQDVNLFDESDFQSKEYSLLVGKVIQNTKDFSNLEKTINNELKKVSVTASAHIILESESYSDIFLNKISVADDKQFVDTSLTEQQRLAADYYDRATQAYDELASVYPQEKMDLVEDDAYAAQGLLHAARLSSLFGNDAKADSYYLKLLESYAETNAASTASSERKNLLQYDTSKSTSSVQILNDNFFISLLDVRTPGREEAQATFFIDGNERKITLRERVSVSKDGYVHQFYITNLGQDYADVVYERSQGTSSDSRTQRLKINEAVSFNGVNVRLNSVHVKQQVKLKILSRGYGPQTSSSFQFKIGIEKRGIRLSPQKTKEMIKGLQESIAMWNGVNKILSAVVSGLKTACFGTSAILTAKNLINGASGESLGRNLLMTNSGGWNEKCEAEVNRKVYVSVEACLLDKKKIIEDDLKIYSGNIKKVNDILGTISDKYTQKGLFNNQVDSQAVDADFKKVFDEWCVKQKNQVSLSNAEKTTITFGDSQNSICKWDTLTHEQRRDIMVLMETKRVNESSVLADMTQRELSRVLIETKNYNVEYQDAASS
ncbi:MAG: hypothetical protein AABX16_01450, partial [Nanoarchaeota archaeon]